MAFSTQESLDTNIILRLILNDVPAQRRKAVELLLRPDVVYQVPDLVITEAVYVLQEKDKTRAEIVTMLEGLFKPLNIVVNLELFEQVLPMYLEHPKLSFNDCYLAALAATNEAEPLWTFDQALAKQSPTAKLVA